MGNSAKQSRCKNLNSISKHGQFLMEISISRNFCGVSVLTKPFVPKSCVVIVHPSLLHLPSVVSTDKQSVQAAGLSQNPGKSA